VRERERDLSLFDIFPMNGGNKSALPKKCLIWSSQPMELRESRDDSIPRIFTAPKKIQFRRRKKFGGKINLEEFFRRRKRVFISSFFKKTSFSFKRSFLVSRKKVTKVSTKISTLFNFDTTIRHTILTFRLKKKHPLLISVDPPPRPPRVWGVTRFGPSDHSLHYKSLSSFKIKLIHDI